MKLVNLVTLVNITSEPRETKIVKIAIFIAKTGHVLLKGAFSGGGGALLTAETCELILNVSFLCSSEDKVYEDDKCTKGLCFYKAF